jgi:hypothetical protein
MDPKTISIGTVAIAALVVAIAKPSTKELVSATESAADKEVTDIVKASPEVKPVTCERKWHVLRVERGPELLWICDDVGYDHDRQAVLAKRGGEGAVLVQYTPSAKDGGVSVDIAVTRGEPRPLPEVPPVDKPAEEPKAIIP